MRGLTTEINEKDIMKNPSFQVWIAAMGAVILSIFTFTAFAFTNFQTKDEARDGKEDISVQLIDLKNELHDMHQELDEVRNHERHSDSK
jgi:hypothetical protein